MSVEDFLKFDENVIIKRNSELEDDYKKNKLIEFKVSGNRDFNFRCINTTIPAYYSNYMFYNNFLYGILLSDIVRFQKIITNKYNNNFQIYYGSNIVTDINKKANKNNNIINGLSLNSYFEKKNNLYGKNIENDYKNFNEEQKKLLKSHIDSILTIVHKKGFSLKIDLSVIKFIEIDNDLNNLPSLKELIYNEYNGNKYITIFILMEEIFKKKYLSDLSDKIIDYKHLTKNVIEIFNNDNLVN